MTPLPQILDEARRVLAAAEERGIAVRLVGGLAVRLRADDAFHPGLTRAYRDIDLVTPRGGGRDAGRLLEELGYAPNRTFNGLHGGERLLFHDEAHGRQLDVFIGVFRMCHEIPLGGRVEVDPLTIPLAELLLTKLQIVRLNEKDVRDVVALLHHHAVGDGDGETINGPRIARLCAEDWGLWRTCRQSVETVGEHLVRYDIAEEERGVVRARLARIWELIEAEPKSRGWRLRDRVGDRKRWYDDPEEVG